LGGLLTADLLEDLFVSFFLEGREELSGRLWGREGVTCGGGAIDSTTSSKADTAISELLIWVTISEHRFATPTSSTTLSVFDACAISSHCLDFIPSSRSPRV
jgi:hypothetical protein